MKISFHQFLNGLHSWGIVGQNLGRALLGQGHEVHFLSTNGYQHFPEDLKPYVKHSLDKDYQCQISYTAMKNFPGYLSHGRKNRFGIWCYEWPILPPGFAKYHLGADKILAPSNFSRDIFIKNGVPAEKVVVVPHGFDSVLTDEKYPLKTTKKKKILVLIGQPHLRKNIPNMLEAFGMAFTRDDDVCLVAKIAKAVKLENAFDVDVLKIFSDFKKKYPKHAEIELITDYIPNIISLYNSCDIVYTLSYCEGFYLPALDGLRTEKINVAPRYGGQLDFLNDNNSLLVDGKIVRAEKRMQYWVPNVNNTVFDSDLQDAANKLRMAVSEYDGLINRFKPAMKSMVEHCNWENVAKMVIDLCQI